MTGVQTCALPISQGQLDGTGIGSSEELERMIAQEQAKKHKALKVCIATVAICVLLIALLAWRFDTDETPLYLLGAPVMFIGACVVLAHGKDYVNAKGKIRKLRQS